MASYYVWSGATGSANGTSWANAYTTLTLAFSGKAAGDVFYVAHDHAESTAAAVTLAAAGTIANPTKVICANRAGSVPPVSADRRTTATVTTTGTSSTLNFSGFTHYDGIIFSAGSGAGNVNAALQNTSGGWIKFDNCSLRLASTGTGKLSLTIDGVYIELNNTTVSFAGTGQGFLVGEVLKWRNTPSAFVGGSTIPTTLFNLSSGDGGSVECIGVDLSAAGSGKTICGASSAANAVAFKLVDCKLDAAVTKSAVPAAHGASEVDFVRSGASGVNYTVFRHRISGTLDHETTIVRTGGASDGTTLIAWKIVTTANCTYSVPFECPPIAIWNDTVGSAKTATVEGVWGGGAVPLDGDIWVDVEYLGDATSPQGSFVNDGTPDLLATPANQTSSSSTWGGSTTKFKLNVTFTAQQKGWIYARVKCAKASSTFYIDPLVTLT
jgi:hypothetical protein